MKRQMILTAIAIGLFSCTCASGTLTTARAVPEEKSRVDASPDAPAALSAAFALFEEANRKAIIVPPAGLNEEQLQMLRSVRLVEDRLEASKDKTRSNLFIVLEEFGLKGDIGFVRCEVANEVADNPRCGGGTAYNVTLRRIGRTWEAKIFVETPIDSLC